MKCDGCHCQIKPVVCLDIDGTQAMYHYHLALFCAEYYELTDVYHDVFQNGCTWDGAGNFEDWLHITQAQYRDAKLAYRQGGGKRTMPIYPDAKGVARALHLAGAEVWQTTTRPWQRLDNMDPDTKEWLRRNNVYYDGLLYDEEKYAKVVESIDPERIVAVIDDLPEQIDRASDLGLSAWQVARPHNLAPSQQRTRRHDLGRIVEIVTDRIEDWNKNDR